MNQSILRNGFECNHNKSVTKVGSTDVTQNLSYSDSITGNTSQSFSRSESKSRSISWSRNKRNGICSSKSPNKNDRWNRSGSLSGSASRSS